MTEFKLLGVIIDNTHNFHKHSSYTIKKNKPRIIPFLKNSYPKYSKQNYNTSITPAFLKYSISVLLITPLRMLTNLLKILVSVISFDY